MAAVAAVSGTQKRIEELTKKLAETNQQIDALDLVGPPTADLEREEAAALQRLARREALNRVSSALNAELAELRAQHAREVEEENQRKAAALQKDIDAARAKAIDSLWSAFEAVSAWSQSASQMEKYQPAYGIHGRDEGKLADKLADALENLGAVRISVDAITLGRSVARVRV